LGHIDAQAYMTGADRDALLATPSSDSISANYDRLVKMMLYWSQRDPDTGALDTTLRPDRITYDYSVASASLYRGIYASIESRLQLERELIRILNLHMVSVWGTTVPTGANESYFDWKTDDTSFNEDQQAALLGGIVLEAIKGGVGYHA